MMPMKPVFDFKEVNFFQGLIPFFEEHGFRFFAQRHEFIKHSDLSAQSVRIDARPSRGLVMFDVSFGSRFETVEKTLDVFRHQKPGRQQETTTSISLAQYLEKPGFRLQASRSHQLEEVQEYLKVFFDQSGFNFMGQLCDFEAVERAFNQKPEKDCPITDDQQLRCFRGVIMASLMHHADWENLKQSYFQNLFRQNAAADRLDNFADLVDYLSNFGLN